MVVWCWDNATHYPIPYETTEWYLTDLPNGAVLNSTYYCWDLTLAVLQCNATFDGDADIGGEGVFASYIFLSIITMFTALAKCLTLPLSLKATFRCWINGGDGEELALKAGDPSRYHLFAQGLLDRLCDLQVITGIGILIAAYSQMPGLSFYHHDLANNYWWLTLGSLFAGDPNSRSAIKLKTIRFRQKFRQWSVVATITLAIPSLFLEYYWGEHDWDSQASGKCYRYAEIFSGALALLGLIGMCFFDTLLIAQLVSRKTKAGLDKFYDGYRQRERYVIKAFCSAKQRLSNAWSQRHSQSFASTMQTIAVNIVTTVLLNIVIVLSIGIRVGMSFIGLGASHLYLEFSIFLLVFVWTLVDIAIMKAETRVLLERSELEWGFGQVLPLVLIATLLFSVCDALDTMSEEEAKSSNALPLVSP